jgi:hypothetical protein
MPAGKESFRNAMGVFATGVAVLTTAHQGQYQRRDPMIPQKQKSVVGLFDRLAKPESTSRDPQAKLLIADGARQARHAVYRPDDLNTNDDSYFADDDTWIE